jgi:hypothetical protein
MRARAPVADRRPVARADPLQAHFTLSGAERKEGGTGRAIRFLGSAAQTRFPDQLAPYESACGDCLHAAALNSLHVRLAVWLHVGEPFQWHHRAHAAQSAALCAGLRHARPAGRQACAPARATGRPDSVSSRRKLLPSLQALLSPALLFCRALRSIRCFELSPEAAVVPGDKPKGPRARVSSVFAVTLSQTTKQPAERGALMDDSAWLNQGFFVAMFRGFQSPTLALEVLLQSVDKEGRAQREEWVVCSILGAGRTREIALEEMKTVGGHARRSGLRAPPSNVAFRCVQGRNLLPIASTAMLVQRDGAPQSLLPSQGRLFCHMPLRGDKAGSGLPVHVSAFFRLNAGRSVSLDADAWNVELVRSGVVASYGDALRVRRNQLRSVPSMRRDAAAAACAAFYAAWPNKDTVPVEWQAALLPPLCEQLCSHQLFAVRSQAESAPISFARPHDALFAASAAGGDERVTEFMSHNCQLFAVPNFV